MTAKTHYRWILHRRPRPITPSGDVAAPAGRSAPDAARQRVWVTVGTVSGLWYGHGYRAVK